MATFVLIPGAASGPEYWHLLTAELRRRGHDVVAVDLPCEDDSAGLSEYADAVVRQTRDRADLTLVAHSFGGFTAPLACERVPVDLLVMLTAMIPAPGEPAGAWETATGHERALREEARRHGVPEGDTEAIFFHDVAPELAAETERHARGQSATPFEKPWPLPAWPNVSTKFLLCRDDRFFPAEFTRRVVRDRLGIVPDEMPGGHMVMLSRSGELADRLVAYQGKAGAGAAAPHVSP
ncbi:alpha/beta hydrolase [Actinoallomurus purpureus]|uniref:alpha/beta hydrolase n=1 Tax=Actinoallomurus purpureus TaxID=478114 RepID=UPI0020924848|nr:alpha/beta hydrolase [Actinoallomurus purpureus]MCO6008668.1 alpha/beta hydrolase [Actinoallomurus purpureus]